MGWKRYKKWIKRSEALENPKEDKLFYEYLNFVKNLVFSIEPPFVLGVLGEWGRGKTTLFNFLCNELKNEFKMVYFESLKYEKTGNLSLAFINKILKELELTKERNVKKFLKKALRSLQVGINVGFINVQSNFEKLFNKQFETIETLKEDFERTLEKVDKNILVFIDDLDRCIPEFALEFLENIRYFFSVNKVIFVVGLDEKIFEIALKKRYGSNSEISARNYLGKFIDLFIRLPNYSVENIGDYINFLVDKKYKKMSKINQENSRKIKDLSKRIPNLQDSSLLTNPRKIDKIIKKMFILLNTVPEESEILQSIPLVFLLLFLKEYYPEVFEALLSKDSINILLWVYSLSENIQQLKIGKNSPTLDIGNKEKVMGKLQGLGDYAISFSKTPEGKKLAVCIIKTAISEIKTGKIQEDVSRLSLLLHRMAYELQMF